VKVVVVGAWRGMVILKSKCIFSTDALCSPCGNLSWQQDTIHETVEVRYKGKNISDVTRLTIEKAVVFFEHIPKIHRKSTTIH